jgi:hypothetical protein
VSRRVPIRRLPTRSLHNLLHQRHGLDRELPWHTSRHSVATEVIRPDDAGRRKCDLLDTLKQPNPDRYTGQRVFVVRREDYVYLVPFPP